MKNKWNKTGIFVRGNTIYVQGSVNGIFYRKSTKKPATRANIAWAKRNARDVLLQLVGQPREPNQEVLFEDYAQEFFEVTSVNRKESTNKKYVSDYNRHILPHFKGWRLNEIRSRDLKQWQAMLLKSGLSGKYVMNLRNVFRGILQEAFIDELIERNPFDRVRAPRVLKPVIQPFSIEEVKLLINEAEGWFKNYLTVAFFTGIRIGELLALRWEDVNWQQETISIVRAVNHGIISTPKTESSIRDVEMLPIVKQALQKQLHETGLKNGFIFLTAYGKNFTQVNKVSHVHWKPLLEKCGLKYRVLYQTRHTFASLMLQQGEEIPWVSAMMGHKDIHTTLTKYAKFIPRKRRKRAQFVDSLNLRVG